MKPEHETQAKAIADGRGTAEASDSDRIARNLARLDQLSSAFKTAASQAEAPRDCLFRWRHLEVERSLDAGGFGEVFSAWDPTLRRYVALKLVPAEAQSELRDRLMMAEAQRMARVRHANILAVHGADVDDGRAGIWCDLLEGQTLEQLVEARGPLRPETAVGLAIPLTDALQLVHSKAMSHGDIKPANIMIEPDGTPVLMDFGAVQAALADDSGFGSPLVMAPEQLAGAPAAPASDRYALGCTLYFALTGRYPIEADSVEQLQQRHRGHHSIDYGLVPRTWRKLLRRLLDPDPNTRIFAEQLSDQLQRLRTRKARRRKQLAAGAVSVSLLVAAGMAWWAAYSSQRDAERIELIKDIVVDSVEASLPVSQSGPASVAALYETLAELSEEKLTGYPKALAEMRLMTGRGFQQLGDPDRGLELAERGHQLLMQTPSASQSDLVDSWIALGGLRKDIGDYSGAELALNQALQQLDAVSEVEAAQQRLSATNRLAAIHSYRGDWHQYTLANQRLLKARQAIHGVDSVRTAVDYHNIASGQGAIGDFEAGIANEQKAQALLEAAGDGESVRMGFILQGLANMLTESGRLAEAQQVVDTAGRLLRGSLPSDHQRLQTLEVIQATLELRRGEVEPARQRLESLLERTELHPIAQIQLYRCLGELLTTSQQWSQASDAYQAARDFSATERYRHYRPFYDGAIAYTTYRAGSSSEPPLPALDAALATLQASGYDQLPQFALLRSWRDTVATSHSR